MAHQDVLFVAVPVVEAVSAAVPEFGAVGALSSAHPAAVPEGLKLRLPNLIKVVAIN